MFALFIFRHSLALKIWCFNFYFYCLANTPQLFPMFGTIEIGISTKRQVRANPGFTLYDQVLDEMHVKNVVCSFGTQSRVNRISHIKPLPK